MRRVYHSHKNFFINIQFLLIAGMFVLAQSIPAFAQLRIVPLGEFPQHLESTEDFKDPARIGASLSLPFFDDFSTTKTSAPSNAYWLPGSGVYVNNTLTNSHPSVNVATFDGLNAGGIPYSLVNPLTQNFTDTLTSQPVNLAGKAAADSVYLSFSWAAKGLGELPDSSDFLQLEFYSKANGWVVVWNQLGYNVDTLFHQQFIAIKDAAYFHDAFQFRFRSYGRNTGPYDTWHLDYVYLNDKRSVKQPYLFDVSVRKPLTSFLKKYTAMPLGQYRVNPIAATADSLRTDIVNHFNNFNVLTSVLTVSDEQRGTELLRATQRSILIESLKSKSLSAKISPPAIPATLDSLHLLSKFYIVTTDTIPKVNLKTNDTIYARTTLSDYYAYDDGSAEYGVQVNQKLGRVAVQYVLSKPDTIGGVRVALVPFNKDISGQSFTVQIYNNKNGRPDRMIAQRSVPVRYASSRNAFIDYAFSNPVAVLDTFYVGWLQINEQPVTVGFDRNSTFSKNSVYYNLGTEWAKETTLNGNIMLRPYLGKKAQAIVTGNEPVASQEVHFFPNPNKGEISWQNKSIKKIEIFSVQGHLIETIIPKENAQTATLTNVIDGMYILKATDGKRSFVQKMLFFK
ncbi:T9SS type A sorting domain-containing protein [Dyadobacter luticola]|uniref:T9SS type A sorting domain-containing protein n=1 Tax=Dyadobacter luticola TaxID=1979387 RepID=A0A5R9KS46_9BACT|nr:T9SS type A sorting domain-containing protein [Dyadobacter luticola]TLU99040.1 T9SS type A sorting domain-containing protein [Dyadobacter luticola]